MLKRVEFEAKTESEALSKASEMLRIQKEKIKLEITKEKKGLLGIGASTFYKASPNVSLVTEGKMFLENILKSLDVECRMEARATNNGKEIHYLIESDENALLIGREGRTLRSLQFLLRNYLNTFVDEKLVISLDIGSYFENHKRQLEILATKTAKEVARTKIAVKLDHMNAYDRRVIHTKLSEWRDVVTESEGEGENRVIVIKPKK